jgi:hypothetical protein
MNGAVSSAESAQEPVDSAIGQWVKKEILQYIGSDRHNLRAGRNAFGELSARRRRRDHDIALACAGLQKRTNLGYRIGARLSLCIEIMQ